MRRLFLFYELWLLTSSNNELNKNSQIFTAVVDPENQMTTFGFLDDVVVRVPDVSNTQ